MPNINKNIIMQAGAAVANATNKAAGLTAATPEPGTIISAIQLVNGGRTIGPDALAHFTESVRNKLLSLLVTMEPIQDFNEYGPPWPGGGGANIWDEQWESGIWDNTTAEPTKVANVGYFRCKNLIPVLPNTAYYFNCPAKYSSYARFVFYDAEQQYISRVGSSSYMNHAFTTPANAAFMVFWTGDKLYANGEPVIYDNDIAINYPSTVTTYSPYANSCPISGWTGLSVYVGPTNAVGDAATYSMDWTSPAGTVYAGSADIVTGDIKAAPYYASYNGETLVGPWVSSLDVYDPEGTPTMGAQVVDLGGTMTEYHITGQDIITLVGDNYIWSDSGDVTITE